MKIRVWPKVSHKTPLYTTIYTYLNQNNLTLIKPYWGSFGTLYYSIKLVLTYFKLIKT